LLRGTPQVDLCHRDHEILRVLTEERLQPHARYHPARLDLKARELAYNVNAEASFAAVVGIKADVNLRAPAVEAVGINVDMDMDASSATAVGMNVDVNRARTPSWA